MTLHLSTAKSRASRALRWAADTLEPLGNDGLTDRERDEMASRYEATIGATPQRSQERTERMKVLAAKTPPRMPL